MKIAVEGCAHGELEKIYDTIQLIEKEENIKIDLLLCCGDFQSTRNMEDLQTMAVPKKYQDICTFYKYYSGELIAPILTIFIGGNHEASNYLQELPYGGWVAPNIYYLGYAGVVRVNGVRIAGLSGIYKGHDYLRGRYEFSPYNEATRKSVYHIRQFEVFRLKQLSGNVDIFLSHDWPRGVWNYGNKEQLLRFKPHFQDDMESNKLGSRPCEDLMMLLKPTFWFAAHLHCKFAALVPHDMESDDLDKEKVSSATEERFTKFLALDKCLPKRRFLQVLDFEIVDGVDEGALRLEYDPEWLSILSLTNHLLNVKPSNYYLPGPMGSNQARYQFTPTPDEIEAAKNKFCGDLQIPRNFCRTAEPYDPKAEVSFHYNQPKSQINPQSSQFCDTLQIDDPVVLTMLIGGHELSHSKTLDSSDSFLTDSSISLGDSSILNTSESLSTPKKLSSLILPTPSKSLDKSTEFSVEDGEPNWKPNDESLESGKNRDENVIAPALAVEVEPSTLTPSKPSTKMFKRRNQGIYQDESQVEEIVEQKSS